MYVLLAIWKGHVDKVWVSDDPDLIQSWQNEVDVEHGIERDEDGNAEFGDWEVTVHDVDQYQITMTVDNRISLN